MDSRRVGCIWRVLPIHCLQASALDRPDPCHDFYPVWACQKTCAARYVFGQIFEAGNLFIPALLYLLYADSSGAGAFLCINRSIDFLLIGAGVIIAIPLLLFSSAVKRLPLYMLGILQYIVPMIAFLLGTFVYKEPFSSSHLIGFVIVLPALVLFIFEEVGVKPDRTSRSPGR